MVKLRLEDLRRELQNKLQNNNDVKRGDIHWVNLGDPIGSIQGGLRPCVIIQNNKGNYYSPTVIIIPISSEVAKCGKLPTHVLLLKRQVPCLPSDSYTIAEQVKTINKFELGDYIGTITDEKLMNKIDKSLRVSMGITSPELLSRQEINTILNQKLNTIKYLDSFIISWKSKGRDLTLIDDVLADRQLKWNDLSLYCQRYNLDLSRVYTIEDSLLKEITNLNRMVV